MKMRPATCREAFFDVRLITMTPGRLIFVKFFKIMQKTTFRESLRNIDDSGKAHFQQKLKNSAETGFP
jgi:hypothetical protein